MCPAQLPKAASDVARPRMNGSIPFPPLRASDRVTPLRLPRWIPLMSAVSKSPHCPCLLRRRHIHSARAGHWRSTFILPGRHSSGRPPVRRRTATERSSGGSLTTQAYTVAYPEQDLSNFRNILSLRACFLFTMSSPTRSWRRTTSIRMRGSATLLRLQRPASQLSARGDRGRICRPLSSLRPDLTRIDEPVQHETRCSATDRIRRRVPCPDRRARQRIRPTGP